MRLKRRQLGVLGAAAGFAAAASGGRRVSQQAAASGRALHAGRHDRHLGARDRGQAAGGVRPECDRGEPAGRRRHHRLRDGGARRSRRPHDADGPYRHPGHQPAGLSAPQLRSRQRLDAAGLRGERAQCAGGQRLGAGGLGAGASGARQGQARRAGLRHRRHGERLASRLGLFRLCHGHRVPARALQGHRTVRCRPRVRPAADGLHRRAGGDAARQAGPPAIALGCTVSSAPARDRSLSSGRSAEAVGLSRFEA